MGKLRYEFVLIGGGRGQLGGMVVAEADDPIASGTLDVTATPTASGAQPLVPTMGRSDVFARLTGIDAPVYADFAVSPDPTAEPRLLLRPGDSRLLRVIGGEKLSAVLAADVPGTASRLPVAQGYVAVPAFSASDTSGPGGTNATIVQVLAGNAGRGFLAIDNNGTADAELWFGAAPAPASVGQPIRRGKIVFANGGGLFRDAKVETSAIYATASAATGLSVMEG
ncbi:hypothetical protein [Methylobacterium sp. sgz302541]|uniref:hypothetical protein n=1 Tax=unclassified Methylobacterium TaxID=2615210 RepID=UPI003D3591BE